MTTEVLILGKDKQNPDADLEGQILASIICFSKRLLTNSPDSSSNAVNESMTSSFALDHEE